MSFMGSSRVLLLMFFISAETVSDGAGGSGTDGNLRLCVVQSRGLYKKTARYCPILERDNSGIECVLATDRLDCLRRMSKGTADMSAVSPEDLLAAQWANLDVLVTHQLTYNDDTYQYSVACLAHKSTVDNNGERIGARAVLQGTRLCHPGHTLDSADFSDAVLAYLESTIAARSCDPNLPAAEDRQNALAKAVSSACDAGPWVPDSEIDSALKYKYGSLCANCYENGCSSSDKYRGRRGVLMCLGENAGDAAWARNDDIRLHFGFSGVAALTSPSEFTYLCKDGNMQPLANDTSPCSWLDKPWPVIVANRKTSPAVIKALSSVSVKDVTEGSWRGALLALMQDWPATPKPLATPRTPVDHLSWAVGFSAAYSKEGCHPSRHITICVWSVADQHKCEWLAEAAAAEGVEPPLQCERRVTRDQCAGAIQLGQADVMVTSPDYAYTAYREYGLQAFLYEASHILNEAYTAVMYVPDSADIHSYRDARGKKACFPNYNGVAWLSAIKRLRKEKLLGDTCPDEEAMANFFGDSCVPGIEAAIGVNDGIKKKLTALCSKKDNATDDVGALKCLAERRAEVAFFSHSTHKKYTDGASLEEWAIDLRSSDFRPVCPADNRQLCYLNWSSIGHLLALANISEARKQELIVAFKQIDKLFGKGYKTYSSMFTLYGQFNHQSNLIFQDDTRFLRTLRELKQNLFERLPSNFELEFSEGAFDTCVHKSGAGRLSAAAFSVAALVLVIALAL